MAKRSATTELNKDNCDIDDTPEDPGYFQQASQETLKKRVIKTARRRCTGGAAQDDAVKNVFAGFSGFSQSSQSISTPAKPSFSFLTASTATPSGSNGTDDKPKETSVATTVNGTLAGSPSKQSKDKEYYSKLKGLNESVSRWVSSHVSKNPLCILTPVFRDYEKHLQAIESARKKEISSEETGKDKPDVIITQSKKDDSKRTDEPSSSEPKEKINSPSSLPAAPSLFGTSFGSASTSMFSQSFKPSDKGGLGGTLFGAASSPPSATMSFGMSANTSLPSAGFTFGGSSIKPFSFANVSKPEPKETAGDNDDDETEEPPKADHKAVTEEGAVYEKRCKVFFKKDDGGYSDRGVGNLFLKTVCDGEKTQLIVRADTSLGNVILNVLLSADLRVTRVKTNNIALVGVPGPDSKPTTALLRVKTSEDADELLASLEKYKK